MTDISLPQKLAKFQMHCSSTICMHLKGTHMLTIDPGTSAPLREQQMVQHVDIGNLRRKFKFETVRSENGRRKEESADSQTCRLVD
ncbi:hypothetical protein RB195_005637 [Necator americanus]|uniref:Uncharacterized protein n=1 Tax=Necator americanus TaxID=51031 RepID=A0ABR1BNU9_NECAM